MKKALTTSEVIAIVFAVIIIAALLYFLWAKGFLPFTWGISESDCKRTLLQFCSNQIPIDRLNKDCAKYFMDARTSYTNCIDSGNPESDDCKDVCSWASGLR
jgi:hypothetical protein